LRRPKNGLGPKQKSNKRAAKEAGNHNGGGEGDTGKRVGQGKSVGGFQGE